MLDVPRHYVESDNKFVPLALTDIRVYLKVSPKFSNVYTSAYVIRLVEKWLNNDYMDFVVWKCRLSLTG